MKMWQYKPFLINQDGQEFSFLEDVCLSGHGNRYSMFVLGLHTCQIVCETDCGHLYFVYHHDNMLSIRTASIPDLIRMPDCRVVLINAVMQNRDAVPHLSGEFDTHAIRL